MLRFYNIFKLGFMCEFSVDIPVEMWVSGAFLCYDSYVRKK